MLRPLVVCFFILCSIGFSDAQTLEPNKKRDANTSLDSSKTLNDSTSIKPTKKSDKSSNKIAKIEQYKIFDLEESVTYFDTSLTIHKEYKFNYLRKDNFGLIPFANLGQTYNQLSKDFSKNKLLPEFGARARHFNYMEISDINYYEVPTPLTELFYKTAFQQGQLLDAFFTVNTSRQFNFSIAYKGLRSLGNYQNALTSSGNLRFTTNFKTMNGKYEAKAHIVTQDLLNQENGGLKSEDLINFTSGNEDFIDRSVFDPNFVNAESILVGKRFFLQHKYNLITPKDSITKSLSIKNVVNFEDKYYQFDQTTSVDYFGESFNQSDIRDKVTLENFNTKFFVDYKTTVLGALSIGVGYSDINYGYDKVTILNDQTIPNRIHDKILSLEGEFSNQIKSFSYNFDFGINVLGDFDSSFYGADLSYVVNDDTKIGLELGYNANPVNYNLLLYQSDYLNYNWNNTTNYSNQETSELSFKLQSKKILNVIFQYETINNYSFFTSEVDSNSIKPKQLQQTINIFKIKLNKEIKFGKFALDNTLLYQNVNDESQSLNLPEFVVRNTFYYSNHFFKNNALYLQTGVTLNYFSDYYMDGYDPLLAEFYSQNQTTINGFPRLDFFVNAKIRQTRIFIKAEHFNSTFTGYNYFSAPNTPYRDFTVRFGLVWDFFL